MARVPADRTMTALLGVKSPASGSVTTGYCWNDDLVLIVHQYSVMFLPNFSGVNQPFWTKKICILRRGSPSDHYVISIYTSYLVTTHKHTMAGMYFLALFHIDRYLSNKLHSQKNHKNSHILFKKILIRLWNRFLFDIIILLTTWKKKI